MIFIHTQQFREHRLIFTATAPITPGLVPKAIVVMTAKAGKEALSAQVLEALGALKKTLLPSQLLKAASMTVVTTGLTAFNIALFGSLITGACYMACTGKVAPQFEKILGKKVA